MSVASESRFGNRRVDGIILTRNTGNGLLQHGNVAIPTGTTVESSISVEATISVSVESSVTISVQPIAVSAVDGPGAVVVGVEGSHVIGAVIVVGREWSHAVVVVWDGRGDVVVHGGWGAVSAEGRDAVHVFLAAAAEIAAVSETVARAAASKSPGLTSVLSAVSVEAVGEGAGDREGCGLGEDQGGKVRRLSCFLRMK